jgi:hypothetical protein
VADVLRGKCVQRDIGECFRIDHVWLVGEDRNLPQCLTHIGEGDSLLSTIACPLEEPLRSATHELEGAHRVSRRKNDRATPVLSHNAARTDQGTLVCGELREERMAREQGSKVIHPDHRPSTHAIASGSA